MPTSAPGSCKAACRGFTLIELLVVVLVMGIALSLVMGSMGAGENRLETEAKRLAALLEHATLRARTTGVPLAWQQQEGGYRFLAREDAWQELPNDGGEVLRSRRLPEGMRLQLVLPGNRPVAAASGPPALVFPATGLAQVFTLRLAGTANAAFRIVGDASGRISVERDQSP
jgi:general secretion pathway protein H